MTKDLQEFLQFTQEPWKKYASIAGDGRFQVVKYNKRAFFKGILRRDKIGPLEHARGHVFDNMMLEWVSKPFSKFYNYAEDKDMFQQVFEQDPVWIAFRKYNGFLFVVSRAIDGTLIFNTSGSIGEDAKYVQIALRTAERQGVNWEPVQYGYTYIFEVMSCEDVHYTKTDPHGLYLLAVRDNKAAYQGGLIMDDSYYCIGHDDLGPIYTTESLAKTAKALGCYPARRYTKEQLNELLEAEQAWFGKTVDEKPEPSSFDVPHEGVVLYALSGKDEQDPYMVKFKFFCYLVAKFGWEWRYLESSVTNRQVFINEILPKMRF